MSVTLDVPRDWKLYFRYLMRARLATKHRTCSWLKESRENLIEICVVLVYLAERVLNQVKKWRNTYWIWDKWTWKYRYMKRIWKGHGLLQRKHKCIYHPQPRRFYREVKEKKPSLPTTRLKEIEEIKNAKGNSKVRQIHARTIRFGHGEAEVMA